VKRKPDIVENGVLGLSLHFHPGLAHLLQGEAHPCIVNGIPANTRHIIIKTFIAGTISSAGTVSGTSTSLANL